MLLTDIDMPAKCIDCSFYSGCSYFKKYCGVEECNPMKTRLKHCPFSPELPKYHGGLKDMDKIYNALETLPAFKNDKGKAKEHQTILDCMAVIDLQPDVIKACREDEE